MRSREARLVFLGLAASVVLVLLAILAFFFLAKAFVDHTTDAIFQEHALPPVSAEAWAEVRVGMTNEQVRGILGEPGGRGQFSLTVDGKEYKGPEYWEYGWTEGFTPLLGGPSDKAYVVYFDQTGKVESFRAPLKSPVTAGNATEDPSARAETSPESR